MSVRIPGSRDELLAGLREEPGAVLLAGGTDLMVEVNFGRRRPSSVISLRAVPELKGWRRDGGELVLGAGLTYSEMVRPPLAALLPALAQAARTVGSPQIRNAGTLGGNLATASPAGDTLPVLLALSARVELESPGGRRQLPLSELLLSAKSTALRPGEVITSVRVPLRRGSQEFLKVGTRNAMVIAVCSVAVVLDCEEREVRLGLGSVGPVPLRAPEAERLAGESVDWEAGTFTGGEPELARFSQLVGAACRPIDDHRSSAAYRRHAVAVAARRALQRLSGPEVLAS